MTEKKDDNLNVLVRSDTKNEDKEIGADAEEEIDEYGEDECDVDCPDTEPSMVRQRSARPAVYGVLAVVAVIAAFLIGSLIGKATEDPEPAMTAEPTVETAIPEETATPEATEAPSVSPVSEEESEEVTENKEEDTDDEQKDEQPEEDADTDEEESEAVVTPEPSATPTPDPSIYNGVAPVIGGKTSGKVETAAHTPTPSQPDDTAVNTATSRLMANHAGMSRAELISGLLSSGYTLEQAGRAADNMAVSWTQQAIYRAMSIYDRNVDTRNTLIVELVLAGFSQSDASVAADAVGA